MRLHQLARVLLLGAACAAGACELATHAADYQVDQSAAHEGLCNACAGTDRDPSRPPCPVATTADTSGPKRVFAARRAHFGHEADYRGPTAGSFALGLDLDCSTRPTLCVPLAPPDAGAEATSREPLPHGIDNALLSRVIGPIYAAATTPGSFDLDVAISSAFEAGHVGVVVVVDGWNGSPDDPSVTVTVSWSPGLVSGAAPRWDGADEWSRFPDVDTDGTRPFRVADLPAYVSDGTLVADARARGAQDFRFGTHALPFRLLVSRLAFSGTLTETGLHHFTMSGQAELPSARDAATAIGRSLIDCTTPGESFFLQQLPILLDGAADQPADPGALPDDRCDAISFGWSFDAAPAHLGGVTDAGLDCTP